MKKVLLVNPYIYDFKAYDEWMRPLGLFRLAYELQRFGIEVSFLDALNRFTWENGSSKEKAFGTGNYQVLEMEKPTIYKTVPRRYKKYGISDSLFLDQLEKLGPIDLVAVTSKMTYWYPGVQHTIKLIRQVYKKVKIVLGGTYATLCSDHAQENSGADLIFKGPITNQILKQILNLLELNPQQQIEISKFNLHFPIENLPYGVLCTSLGCPFKCTYCASQILQPDYQKIPLETVFSHFMYQYQKGARHFAFYDDSLLLDFENNLFIFLKELKKQNTCDVTFHVPNGVHARYITKNVAQVMMDSGFKTIRIGLESIDPFIQKKTGGKTTTKQFENAIFFLNKYNKDNAKIGAYLLVGLDDFNFSYLKNEILWLKSKGVYPNLLNISPVPSTELYQQYVKDFPIIEKEPLAHNDLYFNSLRISDFYTKYQELKNIINN